MVAEHHNPRCAIFREPPGLRSDDDCNCGAVPSFSPPEGKPECMACGLPVRPSWSHCDEISRLRASLAETEAQLAECREFGREALRDAKQERNEARAGLAEAEAQAEHLVKSIRNSDRDLLYAENEELREEIASLRRAGEELADQLDECASAISAAEGTMNFYFGPAARVGVSRQTVQMYERLITARDRAREVLIAWCSATPGEEEDG